MFVEHELGASKFTRDAWRQDLADGPPMPFPGLGAAADGAISCNEAGCLVHPVRG